jgi:Flp pilus assembly protein TadD
VEALRVLLVAESLASNDAVAWRDAGTIYLQLRDYANARRCQEHSLELRPDQTEPRLRLVWILSAAPKPELRDGARALRLSDELLQAGRKDAGVLEGRAAALAELGRYEEALSVMQQVESGGETLPPGHAERRAQYQARQPMRLP